MKTKCKCEKKMSEFIRLYYYFNYNYIQFYDLMK